MVACFLGVSPARIRAWVKHFFAYSVWRMAQKFGTAPLIGEQAQATLRGRPRDRLGTVGSGKGCLRGRPRGRFGPSGLGSDGFRDLGDLGSTHGAGTIL